MTGPRPKPSRRIAHLPAWARWIGMMALSALFATLLELAGFPAALLIGPMLAAIVFGINEAGVGVPRVAFAGGQAIVGCLISASISPAFLPAFAANWALLIACVLATLAASSALGWLISRWGILPGTVGVWGSRSEEHTSEL